MHAKARGSTEEGVITAMAWEGRCSGCGRNQGRLQRRIARRIWRIRKNLVGVRDEMGGGLGSEMEE